MTCSKCGKSLTYNEMGLNKKLVARNTKVFLCKACLADKLDVSIQRLDEKQQQFLQSGCCLFVRED